MTKYAPLEKHLESLNIDNIPFTFGEIEQIIGDQLPPSARKHRAWWSNNPSNSVITNAWLDAGFKTTDVDLPGEKLVFRRHRPVNPRAAGADNRGQVGKRQRHPIFGFMKGTIIIYPGVDLTEPADPDWGRRVYGDDAE